MKIWVVLFSALASASPLFAQEPTPPLVPQHSQTIMETLLKAGPVMIPLFLLSIFFVMLVVVYLMTIRRGAVVSSGYMATADALVNTAAGLAIGIPAMMFYAFFRGRAQKLISELEAASTHVLALLSLQYGKRAERTPVLIEQEL